MGQSQLLLIVLGVIIAGAAVIMGMNIFHANAVESNRNAINSDLLHIATMSQAYYKRSSALGGGGQNFDGFQIEDQLTKNENGEYRTIYLRSNEALFEGVGVEPVEGGVGCSQAGQFVTHRILVLPDSVQIEVIN